MTKRRLPLAAALCLLGGPGLAEPVTVDLELVVAVDVSYSMEPEELSVQRAGYVEAFRSPEVITALRGGPLGKIAVTYVEWGGKAVQVMPWTLLYDAETAHEFAETLERQPMRRIGFTSISNTLSVGRALFQTSPFQARRRVIDISGDGPNNAGAPAPLARNNTIGQGITIDGLPIMLRSDPDTTSIPDLDAYYRECVIGGPGSFLLKVKHIDEFAAAILAKLVIEISGLKVSWQEEPRLSPVQYGQPYNCFIGEELQERAIGR
ncbi:MULTISPECIES: DUF1194 domain-containing protein [unclassified Sinorhizobium]|uniref:DUF1194 domain-containing protein n=1 Tax=unclassified Sinorhizobium TaxID=2613772 RepID=UPI0024C2A0CB|nr:MULTISPECIES: DUF1194 domain-containing protein [unclassified Sinorhizobium]MDK1373550.1 DUF1194 domain-containing protein [Sinorhizobium sp. 6-70]MDK1482137.1 DUF1194 domain-containing protein [Sinorhizobium sp. 6-117]